MAQADSFLILMIRFRRRNAAWLRDQLYNLPNSKIQRQFGEGIATRRVLAKLVKLLNGAVSGIYTSNLWMAVQEGPGGVLPATYASGTIACTFANAANDTITFTYGGSTVVLQESSVLTGPNNFSRGTNDTTLAANLAACIRAHPVLGGLYNATNVSGLITYTGRAPGAGVIPISLTTSDATAFVIVQASGGAEGGAPFFPTQVWLNKNRGAA